MSHQKLSALPLVILTGILLCLDDSIEDRVFEDETSSDRTGSPALSMERGNPVGGSRKRRYAPDPSRHRPEQTVVGKPGGAGRTVSDGYACYIANGLSWLCPNDPYSRTFADLVLRQLEGRYFLGANGHLYLKASNQEHQAACRRFFPGPTGSFATWSWLAEIANFRGPEVWSFPHDAACEERENAEQWRGGFSLITRVLGREGETICRFFSHQQQRWEGWRPGLVTVGADAKLKNGQWTIQWRLQADRDRFLLANDPGVNPEHVALFSEPFFLQPIGEKDLP